MDELSLGDVGILTMWQQDRTDRRTLSGQKATHLHSAEHACSNADLNTEHMLSYVADDYRVNQFCITDIKNNALFIQLMNRDN